jgi:hypothetical protein
VKHYNANFFGGRVANFHQNLVFSQTSNTWKSLGQQIIEVMKQNFTSPVYSRISKNDQRKIAVKVRQDFQNLLQKTRENFSYYSMDLIKGMYRQLDFINKVCGNFDYWNNDQVIITSVARYEKFVQLIKVTSFFQFFSFLIFF